MSPVHLAKDLYITKGDNIITKGDIMRLELKIIDLLAKDMEKTYTINEIAKTLKEHYSCVHKIVNNLAEDGVLIKNKAGKAYLCSLNLKNEKTHALLQINEIEKKRKLYTVDKKLKLILDDFVKSTEPQNKKILAIVLFGSYAKGTATNKSDIDILIISKSKIDIGKISKELYAKYGKEIMPIIMAPNEFETQINKAIIKEIIKCHYVLLGAENFVNLVFKK